MKNGRVFSKERPERARGLVEKKNRIYFRQIILANNSVK